MLCRRPELKSSHPRMSGLITAPGLLTSFDCSGQVHLIVGSNPLARARCAKSLEVGAKVKFIAPDSETFTLWAAAADRHWGGSMDPARVPVGRLDSLGEDGG